MCPRSHSFDIARSGYCNLLQPQDRRSKRPGDTAAAVAARRRFLDAGHGERFLQRMIEMLRRVERPILEAGCGDGYHVDGFRSAFGGEAHGTDISTPAIEAAARRYPACQFVVANADRFLPYADSSFGIVASITARVNPSEFRRVIPDDGQLLIVVPGPDDVIELREAVLGERKLIDRVDRTVSSVAPAFVLERHERVSSTVTLTHDSIEDVMQSTYRGLRRSEQERLAALPATSVTLSRDLLLFRPS